MFDLDEFESEVVALSGVRKVRTLEGAKYYGLPVGSPITANLIALKQKQATSKGLTPPKDALTSTSSRVTPQAPGAPSAEPDGSVTDKIKVKKPSISGPAKFKVGDKEYGAPSGSKVFRSKTNDKVAYVRTPDGQIRAFSEQGEVEIPAPLQNLLKAKFTADFAGDDKYSVEDLTSAADDPNTPVLGNAAEAPAETIAVSTEGEPVFTKNDQGGWTHDELGVEFSDEDVQTLVDNGEILLSPPVEGDAAALEDQTTAGMPDLKTMDKNEAQAALDAMPEGTILNIENTPATFTKQSDGTWVGKSEAVPTGGSPASSGNLAIFRHTLVPADKEFDPSDVADDAAPSQSAPEGNEASKAVAPEVTAQEADKPNVVTPPYPPNKPSALSVGDAATPEWADAAPDGASFEYTRPNGNKNTLTKIDGKWTSTKTGVEFKDESVHNVITKEQAKPVIKADGSAKKTAPAAEATVVAEEDAPDLPPTEAPVAKEKKSPALKPSAIKKPVTVPTPDSEKKIGSQNPFINGEAEKQANQTIAEAAAELKTKPDASATPAASAKTEFKVGTNTTFDSPGDLSDFPLNGVLEIYGNKYTKVDAVNNFLNDNGNITPPHQMVGGFPMTYKVVSLPETAASKVSAEYVKGDKIKKYGHLREMPVGTKIKYLNEGTSDEISITKTEDGWANSAALDQGTIAPGVLADDIIDGNLVMDELVSVGEPSDDLDVQLVPNGTVYSKKQISEAVDALEAHSGFQIAYGFKTIPGHPLADKDTQNAVKEAAMAAYPDLKPKQAFVAYLKDKGGITDAPKADTDAVNAALGTGSAPKIHLGEVKPEAKTIQGYNGGDFTPQDVEDAIAILEGFGGKAFKAELNKKNNPLGILNPNDLVGFNKDKTVTKQKFLDLLKSSLADHKANAPEPEPIVLEQATPAEASQVLVSPDLFDLPVGSVVVSDGGNSYTKTGYDAWTSESSGDIFSTDDIEANLPTLNSKPAEAAPDVPEYAVAPKAVAAKTPQPTNGKVYWDGKKASEAPIGAVLKNKHSEDTVTKIANDEWKWSWTTSNDSDSYMQGIIDSDVYAPLNNEEPLAEWEKELLAGVTDLDAPIGTPAWDGKKAADAPVGSKVHYPEFGAYWQKREDGEWEAYWKHNGASKHYNWSEAKIQDLLDQPENAVVPYSENKENDQKEKFDAPDDAATGPQTNPTGLTPGKYSTATGKAYMVVDAEGNGTYVQANGTVTLIAPEKVKKNFDAGMTTYGGLVNAPEPTDPAAKKPAAKKVKKGPVVLPEGTFYLGDSTKANTTVYVVEGENVKIYKSGSFETYIPGENGVYGTYAPDPSVEAVPLDKIKTAWHQGKIVDASGNSVVPEGYSGPIVLNNIPTSTQALVMAQKSLTEDPDFNAIGSGEVQNKLKAMGLAINLNILAMQVKKDNPDWNSEYGQTYGLSYDKDHKWHAPLKAKLLEHIDGLLEGADTSVPESNASGLFTWGQDSTAQMPLDIASMSHSAYETTALNAKAKAVAAQFGGGKILYPPTSKYDKDNWLDYFDQGNFAAMYQLEVNAFAAKGKSHPAGFMHPGYSGNAETNKIKWGAVVPGETAAGVKIDGDWSSVTVTQWSPAEVDNYLIAAKMQNPEYLSLTEKRQWVNYHKSGYKKQTDTLSAQAANRKQQGQAAISSAPVWTDDIVPAKTYDHLFDNGPYPTGDVWAGANYNATLDWAKDNWSDPEFVEAAKAAFSSNGYTFPDAFNENDYIPTYAVRESVVAYWNAKYQAYQEELNKPVYTKIKLIEGEDAGSHDVWITKDQFDRKYVFKPVDAPDRKWRAEIESIANQMSIAWGFRTPNTKIIELDGEEGLLMDFADHVSSFKGKNGNAVQMSSLTEKQVGQVAAEHVLDWILDNDDTHSSNLLLGTDGNVVGIDKGRAFFVYGNWSGLSADSKAHSNANLIYTKLYDDIRAGKVSQEQAQAAYFAAMKAAKRIQNSDDAAAEARIREATANRPKWSPPGYMTHFSHEQAPQNQDQLVEAFLERKHNMVAEVDDMWDRIFNASPFEKPEAPDKALGEEHFSGWEEGGLVEAATASKVFGAPAIHAAPGIQNGASLLWHEQDKEGKDSLKGMLKVGSLTQKKILSFLKGKAGSPSSVNNYQSSSVDGFPSLSAWKSTAAAAGKDASAHVEDKEFTEETWSNLESLIETLDGDRDFWAPDLPPSSPGSGFVTFPSGTSVPEEGLLQYRQALDHYLGLAKKAKEAREEGKTTSKFDFTIFGPVPAKKGGQTLSGPEGESYTEMYGSGWFHATKNGVEVVPSPPEDVLKGTKEGWGNPATDAAPDTDPVVYKHVDAHDYSGELLPDGTKKNSGNSSSKGHDGYQYEVNLPTGEVITFRNGEDTSTDTSQRGRMTYTLSQSDPEASLIRVQEQMAKMGLDMAGAQPEDAENVYWRSAFTRILLSKGGDSKIEATRSKLKDMMHTPWVKNATGGVSADEFNLAEAVGLATGDGEREFWNNLAVETWGAEKVNDWIAAEKHLPQYQHLNLANSEMNTGMPHFNRIDVDVAALKKTKTLVAIGNNGKDDALLKYITSGGMASTEERLRLLGVFKVGASSSEDQSTGGATGVFTRLAIEGTSSETSGSMFGAHVAYWSPEVLSMTGTYSYGGDNFGNVNNQADGNEYDPVKSAKTLTGQSNETLIQNNLSIFDYMEIFVFENATKRNEAIQRMKAMGYENLRGLPIEERFVMRANLKTALTKVRAAWNV